VDAWANGVPPRVWRHDPRKSKNLLEELTEVELVALKESFREQKEKLAKGTIEDSEGILDQRWQV